MSLCMCEDGRAEKIEKIEKIEKVKNVENLWTYGHKNRENRKSPEYRFMAGITPGGVILSYPT